MTDGCLENGWHGLRRHEGSEHLDVGRKNEAERYEEEQACDGIEQDSGHHGFGNLGGGMLNFFTHAALKNVSQASHDPGSGCSSWGEGGGKKIREGKRGGDTTHEIIIPVEDVAYAACRRPTIKDQPSGHPELFSK